MKVPRRAAYFDSKRPGGHNPFLRHNIPTEAYALAQHSQPKLPPNTHQTLISFNLKGTVTDAVCPLPTKLLLKPLKTRGGSPALGGKPKYTWLTSFPSTRPVFVTPYVTVHAVWNRFAGPPGEFCAGDEMTGGAEEVEVALAPPVDVLLLVDMVLLAVGVAVGVAAVLEAPCEVDEVPDVDCCFRVPDCRATDAGAEDAEGAADETARFCDPL